MASVPNYIQSRHGILTLQSSQFDVELDIIKLNGCVLDEKNHDKDV